MDCTRRLLLGCCVLLILSLLPAVPLAEIDRPRSLAKFPDNSVALITSEGTNEVHYFDPRSATPGSMAGTPLDLGYSSWGAAATDNNRYMVVTHPRDERISVIDFQAAGGPSATSYPAPGYCTTVVATGTAYHSEGTRVFVAHRGTAPDHPSVDDLVGGNLSEPVESWQHAVLEFDAASGQFLRAIASEREPRAVAVSPDGQVLFVGNVQGAVGGPGQVDDSIESFTGSYDGGSILAYDLSDGLPIWRLHVGSPVRGLTLWEPTPPQTLPGGFHFVLYFTHLADGSQSEAPVAGGRAIPNVVSSIPLEIVNVADAGLFLASGSRQDVVFNHLPDALPDDQAPAELPAVLPERLSTYESGGGNFLWVVNSGSSTLSRISILHSGYLDADPGTIDLRGFCAGSCVLPVVANRPSVTRADFDDCNTTACDAALIFDEATNDLHVDISTGDLDSNPRDLVINEDDGLLFVANRLTHELVAVNPDSGAVLHRESLGSAVVTPDEKNFFAFGRGFEFREDQEGTHRGAAPVGTLTCGSCHVDGHIDGKVRVTLTDPVNTGSTPERPKAVATPSIFDSGQTEWLFFDGHVTVTDGGRRDGTDSGLADEDCIYCTQNGFFFDTKPFTVELATPPSPYAEAVGGAHLLDFTQQFGMTIFESLNCTRCHSAGTGEDFLRTAEDPALLPPRPDGSTDRQMGPLPGSHIANNYLLHDPTQVFITLVRPLVIPLVNDFQSHRNMTDVGTRVDDDHTLRPGVNTPALAGAWDNAPYMHDGRYRTIERVLDNTWLDDAAHQAAPRSAFLIPDNAFDTYDRVSIDGTMPDDIRSPEAHGNPRPKVLSPFGTHEHRDSPPPGKTRLTDYLTNEYGQGSVDTLVDFLRGVSSETDLCSGRTVPAVDDLAIDDRCDGTGHASWTTGDLVACDLEVKDESGNWVLVDVSAGSNHYVEFPVTTEPLEVRVSAGSSICSYLDPTEAVASVGISAVVSMSPTESSYQVNDHVTVSATVQTTGDPSSYYVWEITRNDGTSWKDLAVTSIPALSWSVSGPATSTARLRVTTFKCSLSAIAETQTFGITGSSGGGGCRKCPPPAEP